MSLRVRLAVTCGATTAIIGFALVLIATRGAVSLAIGLGVAGGVAAALCGLLAARAVFAPLRDLGAAAQAASDGRPEALDGWRHGDDELAAIANAFEQMTKALHAEGLHATEQRDTLAELVTAMADGVVLVDAEGAIRLVNPAGRPLLGLPTDDDTVGRSLTEVVRDHEIGALVDLAIGGEVGDMTVEAGPERRLLRVRAAPLRTGQGGAVLLLHDLTELRRVHAMRHEFVANASHELLTPIGTVRALADALAHGGLDDRKAARRFLKRLRLEADRLSTLVRDLLDLAQAQSGELRLAITEANVAEVVDTVVERLQTRAGKAAVTLEQQAEADLPAVLADPARLEQVLMNLVDNALKFTAEGGRVSVSVRATADEVVTQVTDTGIGIAAAELPRVFERFYKVRSATPTSGGTGLGLAIARHLVLAMHGHISAESEVGLGSTFTVALPRVESSSGIAEG